MDDALLDKIARYEPGETTVSVLRNTSIALIVGISGAGKDTLIRELLKTDKYHLIVSHTTRPPRQNGGVMERDGVDYHFIDMKTAETLLDQKAFVEAKTYNNNIYGTSVAEVRQAQAEGKVAICDVEVKGVAEYVELTPSVRPFFILPPSFEVWQQRFFQRYGGTDGAHSEDIRRRQRIALEELEHVRTADYYSLVINDDLQTAMAEIDKQAHVEQFVPVRDGALRLIDELIASLRKAL